MENYSVNGEQSVKNKQTDINEWLLMGEFRSIV